MKQWNHVKGDNEAFFEIPIDHTSSPCTLTSIPVQ